MNIAATVKDLTDYLSEDIIRIGKFGLTGYQIVFIIGLYAATKVLLMVIKKSIIRYNTKRRLGKYDGNLMTVFQLVRYIVWILSIAIMLQIADVRLSFFLAGSAALLVGIGLGLQQIFQDIISGIFMLLERNVRVGDVMEIDAKYIGRVTEIGLRTSDVTTRDGTHVIVPNHKFITDSVINWSSNEKVIRFPIHVRVAYGSDVKLVEKLLWEAALEHPDVFHEPGERSILVRLVDFAESGLSFDLLFWTARKMAVEDVQSELRFSILAKLNAHNIEIPFPQREIRIKGYVPDGVPAGRVSPGVV